MQDNLIKICQKKCASDSFMHQRFDGCPLFLMEGIAKAETQKEVRKMKNGEGLFRVCFFKENRADWYIPLSDLNRTAECIIKNAKILNFSKKLMTKWAKDEKLLDKQYLELEKTDLSKLDDKKLINLFLKIFEIYTKRQTSSSLIDSFALTTDQVLFTEIKKSLKENKIKRNPSRVFSLLIAPKYISFLNEASISLFKILGLIVQNENIKNLFISSPVSKIKEILAENHSWLLDLFKEHKNKYFWIKNNYITDYNLHTEDFILEAKHILLNEKNIEKKMDEIEKRILKNKKDLISSLHFTEELKILLKISEDFAKWQESRKIASMKATHYLSLFLNVISSRTNYEVKELKFMLLPEIKNIFSKQKISHEEISKRINQSVAICYKEKLQIITDPFDVKSIKDLLVKDEPYSDVSEIQGLCVCTGKIIAKCRIALSVNESNNIQEGEILIAVMTRPDYFPAMKKASAIVTDEGGVTSHAAIISRELNIPCIVGTKIATKIFRTGDMVEVDANNGTVRKLNQ